MTTGDGAAAVIAAGLAVGGAALVTLHLLPTGLNPVRAAVSQYGISRYRVGYRVQTLGFALAGAGAAVGLGTQPWRAGYAISLCLAFCVSRAAISWFPMDAPETARTTTGLVHWALATVAFVSAGLASGAIATGLHNAGLDPTLGAVCRGLGIAIGVTVVAMVLNRRSGAHIFGLIERAVYLEIIGWLICVAVLAA